MFYICTNFIQKIKLKRPTIAQQCLLCGGAAGQHQPLCSGCEKDLPVIANSCPRCAAPTPVANVLCAECLQQPHYYQSSVIPWRYRTLIRHLLTRFKFQHNLTAGSLLSGLFSQHIKQQQIILPDILLPVPSHPARIRTRGFNSALWLTQQIAKTLELNVDNSLLKKAVNTPAQHELQRKQRLQNLSGAFILRSPRHYQSVAIVDDIVTTGSTVNEVARVLQANGIKNIQVWALARTVSREDAKLR